jgi:hypothetical protein
MNELASTPCCGSCQHRVGDICRLRGGIPVVHKSLCLLYERQSVPPAVEPCPDAKPDASAIEPAQQQQPKIEDQNKTPDELAEADLRAIAVHEMGHFHLLLALNIPGTVEMQIDDNGTILGGCCFNEFAAPTFESACYGWAGIVAEHICGTVYRHGPQLMFPLNEDALTKWHHEAAYYLNVPGKFSDSDRRLIIGHRDTLEACQHTFRILSGKADEIKADARLLADRYRPGIAAKKLAADRADLASKQWLASGCKMSASARAKILEQHLAHLSADHPWRGRFEIVLACLRRGEEPSGELVAGLSP